MPVYVINIAKEYSKTPGGRNVSEGPYSGEDFRDTCLLPVAIKALKENAHIEIHLDGGFGYAPSFLEEAFGGLVRELKDGRLLDIISIISEEEPPLITDISKYMKEALKDLPREQK